MILKMLQNVQRGDLSAEDGLDLQPLRALAEQQERVRPEVRVLADAHGRRSELASAVQRTIAPERNAEGAFVLF